MKKFVAFSLIFVIFLTLLSGLASCTRSNSSFRFKYDLNTIYMDEGIYFTPEVIVLPKSDYTLTSSNPALIKVLDDGISVQALKVNASVTLTATSGDRVATSSLITLETRKIEAPSIPETTYTVTFDTQGKGSLASQKIAPGQKATRPQGLVFADSMIADWYLNESLTDLFDFATPITQNLILYAKWVTVDNPTFTFVERENAYFVSGLVYPYVEYDNIAIPDTYNGKSVTGIAESAFYKVDSSNNKIEHAFSSVTIPASIKTIEANAFYACTKLVNVYFDGQSNLTSIAKQAFSICEQLENITIPASVNTIGEKAFRYCDSLTYIELPSSLTKLGAGSFQDCPSLEISALPSALKEIPESCFSNTAIKSINLATIEKIQTKAFQNSKSLKTITNTASITVLESLAFDNTAWYNTEKAKTDSQFIILNDILVFCKAVASTKGGIFVTVPENIRMVANLAFPSSLSNGFVHFTQNTPPSFNAYAFGSTKLDICVPKSRLSEYRTNIYKASGLNGRAIFFEEVWEDSGYSLTLYIDEYTNRTKYQTDIIIQRLTTSLKTINLNEILQTRYEDSLINILKIKNSAIANSSAETTKRIPNLETLILPARVQTLESNCIYNVPITVIKFVGNWGDFVPSAANIPDSASSIKPGGSFVISVPEAKLNAYKSGWSTFKSIIVGY